MRIAPTAAFEGLARARALTPAQIVDEIRRSGLRGRGGAAFPAAIKWQTVLDATAPTKYVVCNADEGDSGTFADRLLIEADPFQLIEGMLIAALATGASRGFVYLRSEYPRAQDVLDPCVGRRRAAPACLDRDARGTGRPFDIELRIGAGAYVCGEETSLLESIEGKRGPGAVQTAGAGDQRSVRQTNADQQRADAGRGNDDPRARRRLRTRRSASGRSRGTMPFQLSGNIAQRRHRRVAVRRDAARTDRRISAAAVCPGEPLRAAQVGGPLGAYLPQSLWDIATRLRSVRARVRDARPRRHRRVRRLGGPRRAGRIRDAVLRARIVRQVHAVPHRFGARRRSDRADSPRRRGGRANVALLEDLCETMESRFVVRAGWTDADADTQHSSTTFGRTWSLQAPT